MAAHPLEQALLRLWPRRRWLETRILVAVSGGADSVALLRAILNLAPNPQWIDAAHFNHGWRGAESDQDERFVRQLCAAHGIRCYASRAEQTREAQALKSEERARTDRYEFLTGTAYATGARYVATAHTASDRIETLLHNLLRGTGLAGVGAPTFSRNLDRELVLVRPLLDCSRELVLDYLSSLGQSFQVDSSNDDQSFRRNFLRHTLLPLVREQYGPSVDAKLLSFCELADDANAAIEHAAAGYLRNVERIAIDAQTNAKSTKPGKSSFALPTSTLLAAPWPVVQKALTIVWLDRGWPLGGMSRGHWDAIRRMVESPGLARSETTVNLPGNICVVGQGEWLRFFSPSSRGKKSFNPQP